MIGLRSVCGDFAVRSPFDKARARDIFLAISGANYAKARIASRYSNARATALLPSAAPTENTANIDFLAACMPLTCGIEQKSDSKHSKAFVLTRADHVSIVQWHGMACEFTLGTSVRFCSFFRTNSAQQDSVGASQKTLRDAVTYSKIL